MINEVSLTDDALYGYDREAGKLIKICPLPDSPRTPPLRQILEEHVDLNLDQIGFVEPDQDLTLEFLFDETLDQSVFWTCIFYITRIKENTQNFEWAHRHIERALKQHNPFVRAMLHLVYKHGLLGANVDPLYAIMYKRGADEGILKADQDYLEKGKKADNRENL